MAEVQRNPEDARSVFYLAQSYYLAGDFANARTWYARRAEMGGWAEEVYYSMYQIAVSMAELNEPWPLVQDAYLRAWEFRPTRAEPFYAIARRYREDGRYRLGHLFAGFAAAIPFPGEDSLFVRTDVYGWRAIDEQAVCASWIGKQPEAFALSRQLLAQSNMAGEERQRIAGNRDHCAPPMIDAASPYPEALVQSLLAGPRGSEVVISLIAGPDRAGTEQTLNSFLHCCTDISQVGRFLTIDAGLSDQDRTILRDRYPFLEFADAADRSGIQSGHVRSLIDARFWLHLGQGWRFFAPENLITRLTAVLEAEARVVQVGINYTDAVELTGTSPPKKRCTAPPAPADTCSPIESPTARPCSRPNAWTVRAVWIRSPNSDAEPPPPGYTPPPSTRSSASQPRTSIPRLPIRVGHPPPARFAVTILSRADYEHSRTPGDLPEHDRAKRGTHRHRGARLGRALHQLVGDRGHRLRRRDPGADPQPHGPALAFPANSTNGRGATSAITAPRR